MRVFRFVLPLTCLGLFACPALAAEAFNNYGAQQRARPAQPSQAAVDAAVRGRTNMIEDRQREDMMRERSDYLDEHGYDSGRRAEAGDRFRYGADRMGDDYGRANAPDRFPEGGRPQIDRSGNALRPSSLNGSSNYSGSNTTTRTTTINQSRSIDASGNIVP